MAARLLYQAVWAPGYTRALRWDAGNLTRHRRKLSVPRR